jgi:uncharacterized protein (TIGR03083 family)
MGVTPLDDPRELDELLGAYALDACEPDEAGAVEAYLARSADAATEVARLRDAAAWVGATEALVPPPTLRGSVLAAARARRGAGEAADPVLELYLEETARFDGLVDGLAHDVLETTTFNGLSVRDLVIHLAAQESLVAATMGTPVEGVDDIEDTDIERRTAAFVARFHDRPVGDARAIWARAVTAVRRWAAGAGASGAVVRCFGLPMPRETVLINRSFETWIHSDDIRRSIGRSLRPPTTRNLRLMTEFSMHIVPPALRLVGRERPGWTAQIVLTGDGGGDWLVPLHDGDAGTTPDVVLTADVVDWCLLVGERIAPAELEHTVEGDATLAADIVSAAPSFAML